MSVVPETCAPEEEMTLKEVGFWSDLRKYNYAVSHDTPDGLPDPRLLVHPEWMKDQREEIVKYLEAGQTAQSWLGFSYCRFECGESQMVTRDFTDGVYLWPEGLSHYVKKHHVALPFDFALHILRQIQGTPKQAPRQIQKP